MATFNPGEIYQFAVKIEENGEKYYRWVADTVEKGDLEKLFEYLADAEVNHKKVFKKMLSRFEDYKPRESYPDEYFKYLRAYADNLIFSIENLTQDMQSIETARDAIQYGISKELETIAYYREMKNLISESEQDKINDIIEEEKKHVLKLSEIEEEYKNSKLK